MVMGFVASSSPLWKQESFFRIRLILAMKGIVLVRIDERVDSEWL